MYCTVYCWASWMAAESMGCAAARRRAGRLRWGARLRARDSGLFFRYSKMFWLEGCAGTVHFAWMAAMACSAVYASGATTPMKSPSRTSLTPGIFSAAAVSSESSVALKPVARRTLPNIMPGSEMSDGYLCFPVTNSRPFGLGNGRAGHLPVTRWSQRRMCWRP